MSLCAYHGMEAALDLHFIDTVVRPTVRGALPAPAKGDAYLAGGTWLYSVPQPDLRRLIDLGSLGWPALQTIPGRGLEIAATCRLEELERYEAPTGWTAAALFARCCRSLWGSFKIRHAATVGGNLCLGLPAGPMAALMTALHGDSLIWSPDGTERRLPAALLVVDAGRNALRDGEVLRSIQLPEAALGRVSAFRQVSLTRFGRSAALLIGTRDESGGGMELTITAAVRAPVRLAFKTMPSSDDLARALATALPQRRLHDDLHGTAAWKRHMAGRLAEEIRRELAA